MGHREEEAGPRLDTEKKGGRGGRINAESGVGLQGNAIMKPITNYNKNMILRNRRKKKSPQVTSQLQTGPPTLVKN